MDDEADASACGSDGEEEGAAAAVESLGSPADFIAEPTEDELAEAGLAFHSDDDDDPLAVLRNARPFQTYRRMGAAAADNGAPVQQRRREPRPSTPVFGAAAVASGDTAGIALLQSEHPCGVDPSFLATVSGCGWLSDVSLLHDADKSQSLYADLLRG